MKIRKKRILLFLLIAYLGIGVVNAVILEVTANPEDTPVPIWAPGLSVTERIEHFFTIILVNIIFWPIFLPPTVYYYW